MSRDTWAKLFGSNSIRGARGRFSDCGRTVIRYHRAVGLCITVCALQACRAFVPIESARPFALSASPSSMALIMRMTGILNEQDGAKRLRTLDCAGLLCRFKSAPPSAPSAFRSKHSTEIWHDEYTRLQLGTQLLLASNCFCFCRSKSASPWALPLGRSQVAARNQSYEITQLYTSWGRTFMGPHDAGFLPHEFCSPPHA